MLLLLFTREGCSVSARATSELKGNKQLKLSYIIIPFTHDTSKAEFQAKFVDPFFPEGKAPGEMTFPTMVVLLRTKKGTYDVRMSTFGNTNGALKALEKMLQGSDADKIRERFRREAAEVAEQRGIAPGDGTSLGVPGVFLSSQ